MKILMLRSLKTSAGYSMKGNEVVVPRAEGANLVKRGDAVFVEETECVKKKPFLSRHRQITNAMIR